jgi:hypothetical protein
MATLEFKGFKKTRRAFRFYSKYANWEDIIQEATWELAEEIEAKAKEYLKQRITTRTGKLENSIYVVSTDDGIAIKSNHPAAYHIEYGGYQPKNINPDSETIKQYAEIYGIRPWHLKKGLEKSDFFKESFPFAYMALQDKRSKIKKRIISLAIEKKNALS